MYHAGTPLFKNVQNKAINVDYQKASQSVCFYPRFFYYLCNRITNMGLLPVLTTSIWIWKKSGYCTSQAKFCPS